MITHSEKTQKAFLRVSFYGVLKDSFTQNHVDIINKYESNYSAFVEYVKNLVRGHLLNKQSVDHIFGFLEASHFSVEAMQLLAVLSKKTDYETYSKILFENKKDAAVLVNAMSVLEKLGELHSKSLVMKELLGDFPLSKGLLLFLKINSQTQKDFKFLETILPYKKVFNQPKILGLLEKFSNEDVLEEDIQKILNICLTEDNDTEEKSTHLEKELLILLEEQERLRFLGVAYDFLGFFANHSNAKAEADMSLKKNQLLDALVSCNTQPDYSISRKDDSVEVYVVSLGASESFSASYVTSQRVLLYVISVDIQDGSAKWSVKKDNRELLTENKVQNYNLFSDFMDDQAIANLSKNYQLPVQKPTIVPHYSYY